MRQVRGIPSIGSWSTPIDAIIVPASRGIAALDAAANLSIRMGTPLLVLCSRDTPGVLAAEYLRRKPGCLALTVDVPAGYRHDLIPTRTSGEQFRTASAGRDTDLSLKRNLGLLLARLNGWGKILFLDDDIGDSSSGESLSLPVETAHLLAQQLDSHQVAGLACRDFPDNSVVCHARRLAGLRQDTFITGAALGVNCNDQPLPFFPELYNEDWFFFSRMAARKDLAHIGYATQAPYDPYADPRRAREEEFGDLLAEGLYALFEDQPDEMGYVDRLEAAGVEHWRRFIATRQATLRAIRHRLGRCSDPRGRPAAIGALRAAEDQLASLCPEVCVDFLREWCSDLVDWEHSTQLVRPVGCMSEALSRLELVGCRSTGFPGRTPEHSSTAQSRFLTIRFSEM